MNKKGNFKFKAVTSSVSGAAVIGGIFLIALGAMVDKPNLIPIGVTFTVLGVVAAIIITAIIKWS